MIRKTLALTAALLLVLGAHLRPVCDYEIAKADGWSGRSERCQAALKELYELYYTSEKTVLALRPPVE